MAKKKDTVKTDAAEKNVISNNFSVTSCFTISPMKLYQTKLDFINEMKMKNKWFSISARMCRNTTMPQTFSVGEKKFEDVLKPQYFSGEHCNLEKDCDCLIGQYTIEVDPLTQIHLHNCSSFVIDTILKAKADFGKKNMSDVIYPFALNAINGRTFGKYAFRNIDVSCGNIQYVIIEKMAKDGNEKCNFDVIAELDSTNFGCNKITRSNAFFNHHNDDVYAFAQNITDVLFGDDGFIGDNTESDHAIYRITIFVKKHPGAKVFPSQLFKHDHDTDTSREPKEYFKFDGTIAFTSESVGCGLRTFDRWYEGFDVNNIHTVNVPIRPFAQDSNRGLSHRFLVKAKSTNGLEYKTDFYSILKLICEEQIPIMDFGDNAKFFFAVILFGGVFNVKKS